MLCFLEKEWHSICPEGTSRRDSMGNLEFSVTRGSDYPTLALVAHADTIATQLTSPIGKQKYRFRSIGSSPHMLLGQPVTIINETGECFEGVIGFDATSQCGQPKGLVFEDLWIDILADDSDDKIEVGDLAVLNPRCHVGDKVISGTALDDRVGLFIMTEILEKYSIEGKDWPVNLICAATVQEEVGLRGASRFEFSQNTDAVLVIDVDYATDIPTPHEDQMGRLYLHAGPGVHRKADNNSELRRLIMDVAKSNHIPLQISLGRFVYGGTDATQLQVARTATNNRVCNITIPCRYMHSSIESVSRYDICCAIELIKALLLAL